MIRIVCVLMAGLILSATSVLRADERRPYFEIDTGFTIPVSEGLSDFWNSGLGMGVKAGYVLNSKYSLLGSVDFTRFGINPGKLLAANGYSTNEGTVEKGNVKTLAVFANLKFGGIRREDLRTVPFFMVGAGFFRFSSDEILTVSLVDNFRESVTPFSENTFGITAGGGVNIQLTDRIDLVLEGRFVVGFTPESSTQYFPVKVGIGFQ
jgi:opacity protein-like surface antigen